MAKEKSTKKTNMAFKNFMSYCEDLSTFLDEINRYCKDNYDNNIPKEQKFITYQAIRNFLGYGEIKNKSEATEATQFMNKQLKNLLEAGVLVHSKKASQKKMTIVGKLYVEMPNYYKDNVEAISERLTNASICEPSEESVEHSKSNQTEEESNTEMTTENLQLHDPLNESPDEVEQSDHELSPVYPPAANNYEISYDESGSEVDTSVPQSKRVKFNEKPQIKNLSDSSSDSEEEEPPAVPPRKPMNRKKQVDLEPESAKITKKAQGSKVSKSKKSTKGKKTTKNSAPDDVSNEKNEDEPSEENEDVPAEKVVKAVKGRRAAHKKVAEPEVKPSNEKEQAPKKGSGKKKIVSHIDQSIQDVGDPVTASTPMVEKPVSKKKKKKSPTNKAKALKSKARRRSSVVTAARKSIEKAKTPIKSRIRSGIVSKKKTADSPELKTKSRKKKTIGKKAKA